MGDATTVEDIANVLIGYLRGTVKRLPWCEGLPAQETGLILKQLFKYNQLGLLTINSQPRVNGALSTDPSVGWGPAHGFVYQKAYVELFCSPESLEKLARGIESEKLHFLSYTAVDKAEDVRSNNPDDRSVNALTWGIFPGKEVVQPTVVDTLSFMACKHEAFGLWDEWGLRPRGSCSSRSRAPGTSSTWWTTTSSRATFSTTSPASWREGLGWHRGRPQRIRRPLGAASLASGRQEAELAQFQAPWARHESMSHRGRALAEIVFRV